MKLSMLEITLAAALEDLIRASEYQMVDEDGVMGDEDKKTLKRAKNAIKLFHKQKEA